MVLVLFGNILLFGKKSIHIWALIFIFHLCYHCHLLVALPLTHILRWTMASSYCLMTCWPSYAAEKGLGPCQEYLGAKGAKQKQEVHLWLSCFWQVQKVPAEFFLTAFHVSCDMVHPCSINFSLACCPFAHPLQWVVKSSSLRRLTECVY